MFQKLEEVAERFKEVEGLLAESAILANRDSFLALTREHAELSEIVEAFSRYKKTCEEIEGLKELLQDADAEVRNMAKVELPELETSREDLEKELQALLLPKDPNDDKNIFLEIRAGTVYPLCRNPQVEGGGDESFRSGCGGIQRNSGANKRGTGLLPSKI